MAKYLTDAEKDEMKKRAAHRREQRKLAKKMQMEIPGLFDKTIAVKKTVSTSEDKHETA